LNSILRGLQYNEIYMCFYDIKKSFDAWSGCIVGALERNKYIETIKKAGFQDVEIVNQNCYSEEDMDSRLVGKITSVQVRATK